MKFLIAILTILVTVFSSCEKAPKCWGKNNINTGEIIGDTTLCANCNFIANENKGYVINSTNDLNEIFASHYGITAGCELNEFNLDKYSLLALPTITTCKYKMIKTLTIDDANKRYVYAIEIDECGTCHETNYKANWIVIPKIKKGYSVLFKTLRIPA